jgi:hypothetical protein
MATRLCDHCGEQFEYPAKRKDRRYCSRNCRSKHTATPERMSAMRAARVTPMTAFVPEKGTCSKCGNVYKPTSARQRVCFECTPDKGARARLRRYGLSEREWDELAARFDGMCWICHIRPASCVDHDHETGAVRGALCRTCNMVLHYVERPDWWADARAYLEGGIHCGQQEEGQPTRRP